MSTAGVGRRPGAGASSGLPEPRQRGHPGRVGTQAGWAVASPEAPLSLARAIDDKYSRREEYRGFTQDFKEKDGYKPDVKIEYVDETGRKLTPKEVRSLWHGALGVPRGLGSVDHWLGALENCPNLCAFVSLSGGHCSPPHRPGRSGGQVPWFLCSPVPSVA